MKVDFVKNEITINDIRYRLSDVIRRLSSLNGKVIGDFFKMQPHKLPRKLLYNSLRKATDEIIMNIDQYDITIDKKREIKGYEYFSESMLEIYFDALSQESNIIEFKNIFISSILLISDKLEIRDKEIVFLLSKLNDNKESISEYFAGLEPGLCDFSKEYDGLSEVILRQVLTNYISLVNIKKIADKYHLVVPIKKKTDDFYEDIRDYLSSKNELTFLEDAALKDMSYDELSDFCKSKKLRVSAYNSKTEIVNRMIFEFQLEFDLKAVKPYEIPKFNLDFKYETLFEDTNIILEANKVSKNGKVKKDSKFSSLEPIKEEVKKKPSVSPEVAARLTKMLLKRKKELLIEKIQDNPDDSRKYSVLLRDVERQLKNL